MIKKPFGLVPADSWSEEKFGEAPIGTRFAVKSTTSRSTEQLGLYWSVLKEVCNATDAYPTAQHLHAAIMEDLGYRHLVTLFSGEVKWERDSAAFDKMTQAEFNVYFEKAIARMNEFFGYDVLSAYEEMRGSKGTDMNQESAAGISKPVADTLAAPGVLPSPVEPAKEAGGVGASPTTPPATIDPRFKDAVKQVLAISNAPENQIIELIDWWKGNIWESDHKRLGALLLTARAIKDGKRTLDQAAAYYASLLDCKPEELK